MSIVEGVGHLDPDLQNLGHFEGAFLNPDIEWRAFHVLHRQKPEVVILADFVDVRDVWMRQRGSEFSLLNKALHTLRVGGDLRRQHLERHAPAETDIIG